MKEPEENLEHNRQQSRRIAYLVSGFLQQTLTEEEKVELDNWINASDQNLRLFEDLTDTEKLQEGFKQIEKLDAAVAMHRIQGRIHIGNPPVKQKIWWRYAAAAAILILFASAAFYFFNPNKRSSKENIAVLNDIAPGGNKAILTLSDGSVLKLDETPDGVIGKETKSNIIKNKSGELMYTHRGNADHFNVLTTPRGGGYHVVLSDGTKVWLNAASSLKYPLAFSQNTREVELTGEAYFEVAKDASKPFFVKTTNQQVEVLGTNFNINAYEDEPAITTSLLEGKIKVSSINNQQVSTSNYALLQQGQQSNFSYGQPIKISNQFDPIEIIAWKEGNFEFKDASIEQIMRQVARWYDAEIIYEEKPTYHFNASVDRNTPVSKLLHFLEMTNRVHFTIKGKTIIVKS